MKGNMEERELLREYVEHGSEAAFAQLVQSHIDLVHSTAVRLVGDADLAKDVCQSVFLRLAKKASSVRKAEALAGWLYRTTRFEAASLIRGEQRRRNRETEAMRRADLNNEADLAWASILPFLDEAMGKLKPRDQSALLLRFFENRPLAEVGQALGLSEDAARKRIGRSLDQLQSYFQKRGIGIPAASLGGLLAANAVEPAPPGLAAALATTALAGGATSAAGLLATLTPALLMTKTTGSILAVLVLGAVITPVLLHKSPPPGQAGETAASPSGPGSAPEAAAPAQPARPRVDGARAAGGQTLLARVAALPPLTARQIEVYVEANKRNAESLLAAYRASTNLAYLTEAARRFPADPDVQYAVIASRAAPDVQRQWIEAYKTSSPDNALAWYFSALEHYRTGDTKSAIQDLLVASQKPAFRADLAPTLQAMQELHVSAGRAPDEARIAAFQESAHLPHLGQMRELANAMQRSLDQLRREGNAAAAQQLAGSGMMLGSHLSAGGGSQTVINQLVGIAIEQKFLQQLDPAATTDPFGRSVAEVKATIENHKNALREHAKSFASLIARLDDAELANYMERVKLYGEEAALVWAKDKHGDR